MISRTTLKRSDILKKQETPPTIIEVSDCCGAEVSVYRSPIAAWCSESPSEPVETCTSCGQVCGVVDEEDEDNKS
ncbi:hypothetical protein LCGC14_2408560 [marine sediment metagenome]|uniref:Uncharacterized protein n=1 Tax=marine sediment metagenome TaxID=412755 RepID=A0A0F9BT05_9ZZZZ